MFYIRPSNETPKPKITIKEGFPDAAASIPDICIINDYNAYNSILLNSKLLREALLNSKEFLKTSLGIVVSEYIPEKETVTKKTTKKKVDE